MNVFQKRNPPPGSHPGAFAQVEGLFPTKVHVIAYSADQVDEFEDPPTEQLAGIISGHTVTWINIDGLLDEARVRELGEHFRIHPLALADVVNSPQRPKAEEYEEHLFLIARMLNVDGNAQLNAEQVSIFLGENYVISFQEAPGDVLDPLRKRIRNGHSAIRTFKADFLAYSILDTIIDAYFPVLEFLGTYLTDLEDETLEHPSRDVLLRANRMRRTLFSFLALVWPQREAIATLMRGDHRLLSPTVRLYLRDSNDHCTQIAEALAVFRDLLSAIVQTFLSMQGNRMNEITKVLTIVASIFIPLTFMVGVYGMNFDYMPELHYHWGYPLFWLVAMAVAVGLVLYFVKLGWIRFGRSSGDE
jgi:magnesium transporter